MGKEPEAPVVITPEKKSGPSPVVWGVLAAVLAFPASLLSAMPLSLAARKGFARANLVYLTIALTAVTTVLYLAASEPITGYLDAMKSLVAMTGLIDFGDSLTPNFPLFVTAGLTVGCLLATVFAVAWRNSHKDDEDWVEEHPEKLDALTMLVVRKRNAKIAAENEKVIEKIAEGEWFGPEEVGLGYALESVEPGRKIEPIGLPDLVGGSVNHSLILGSSGRGKTQTITRQAFDAIKNGCPVLVVDAKGDGDLAAKLGAYAEEFGRPFYHFSIPSSTSAPYVGPSEWGRAFYDPAGLSAGNHTRRRDFMMNARDWTGAPAVYSDKTRDWLSRCLWVDNVVAEVNGGRPLDTVPQATFSRIADFMSPMTTKHYLREAANLYGADALTAAFGTTTFDLMMAELEEYATMKDQTGESARMSHAAWLRTFMSSVTGPYLRDTGDDRTIDIARIVSEQAVCVFDLATDQYREEAPAIARLVVADLLSYISSAGKADGMRLRVFLDEFAAVGGEESANVLARARSAGVSFTLSTQTLSDLRDVSEAFEGQVLTNSLNLLIHNASTWDEAERLAGMTGQVDAQRITKSARMDGGGDGAKTKSITTERRYRVEASEFMEMGVGELVKISQVERGADKAIKVAVVMPPKIAGTTYTVETAPQPSEKTQGGDEVLEHDSVVDDEPPMSDGVVADMGEGLAVVEPERVEVNPLEGDDFEDLIAGSSHAAEVVTVLTSDELASDDDAAPEVVDSADDGGLSPLDFVRESEEERKARIAALAASGPLFDPVLPDEPVIEVAKPVALAPAAEDADPPVRPQRSIRRRDSD